MARFTTPTPEEEGGWNEWVSALPSDVRVIAEKFDPWSIYKMKSTGDRVTIYSFSEHEDEPVTLTVSITGEFNKTLFNRNVFGIDPNDLEPCDLPNSSEELGSVLGEITDDNIDFIRTMTRPDLWVMGSDGKAIWKGEGDSPDCQCAACRSK